jgi:hypothetical protein
VFVFVCVCVCVSVCVCVCVCECGLLVAADAGRDKFVDLNTNTQIICLKATAHLCDAGLVL